LVSNVKGSILTRVYESRVLRRVFGLKRDEIIAGWRKLNNKGIIRTPYQILSECSNEEG
jgi:hypothetical protein